MSCAGRSPFSVTQRKAVTKAKENCIKNNGKTKTSSSNCLNCCGKKSTARDPLKDLKNQNCGNNLSVEPKCDGPRASVRTPSPRVKTYSIYSVKPIVKQSLNTTYSKSPGPSDYIREAFKNEHKKKMKKNPKREQDSFWKELKLVKKNFNRSKHYTVDTYVPVLTFVPHSYPEVDYHKLGFIFDAVPNRGVRKQEATPFTYSLPSNVVLVAIDGKDELLPSDFLKSVKIRIGLRTTLVDWIAKLRDYLKTENNVLFMTIKIFDKLLARHNIEENKFQLYATAAFWISYKHYNTKNQISAPDLLKLTINRHTVNDLLKTEQDIYKFLNFKLHTDLPMCHIYNFICVTLNISDNNDIYYCANFFLEILLLDPDCNCYPVSLQACAAVYLALKLFKHDDCYFEKLNTMYWSHNPGEMGNIHKSIIEFVLLTSEHSYRYRNSYFKYATERYGEISVRVAKIVADL